MTSSVIPMQLPTSARSSAFFVIVFVGIFALMAIPNAVTHITGQISLASIAPQALRVAGR